MNSNGTQKYSIECFIGCGTFGHVFKATNTLTKEKVAWKRIPKITKQISREVEILETIKNQEYLVSLIDIFYSISLNNQIIQNLIFPFYECDLERLIKNRYLLNIPVPYIEIKKMIYQITLGLRNLHVLKICHRDLKPENILQKNGRIFITDFGSAKILNTYNTPYAVSRYYRSPELLLGILDYNNSIDIWALGVMTYEFLIGDLPFKGKTEGQQFIEIIKGIGFNESNLIKKTKQKMSSFDARLDLLFLVEKTNRLNKKFAKLKISTDEKQLLGSFLKSCFEFDHEKRMDGVQAASHEYFNDLKHTDLALSINPLLFKDLKIQMKEVGYDY